MEVSITSDRPSSEGDLLQTDERLGEHSFQYFDFLTSRSVTVVRNLGNVFLGLTASQDARTIFHSRVDSSCDELMLEPFRDRDGSCLKKTLFRVFSGRA
jgi:hypothetical protein